VSAQQGSRAVGFPDLSVSYGSVFVRIDPVLEYPLVNWKSCGDEFFGK